MKGNFLEEVVKLWKVWPMQGYKGISEFPGQRC